VVVLKEATVVDKHMVVDSVADVEVVAVLVDKPATPAAVMAT